MTDELLKIRDTLGGKKQVSKMLYSTLKEAIATGVMKPGSRLTEEDIANTFQVSRTPVRETIKRLENEDIVSYDSARGYIVRELKLNECLDILELLELLRSDAVDLLNGKISRNILMRLETNLRYGENLTDPLKRFDNNTEFHSLLIHATENTELINIASRLEFKERQIMINIYQFTYADDYVQLHRKLLKAILNQDTEFLKAYKERHQKTVKEHMNSLISTFLQ